mmetsp:Transcript_83028/g.146679  ORF Transcript_83028/g.146679 Transcript_83028/m.146679 type:complete len:320 (-) Transcript_83028:750-1709(-)
MAPGRQMHHVYLTTTARVDLRTALEESQQQRSLQWPLQISLIIILSSSVSEVGLRNLQGDFVWHNVDLHEEGWCCFCVNITLESPHLLVERLAKHPARGIRKACHGWGAKIRIHKAALKDRVKELHKVVNSQPNESVVNSVTLLRGDVRIRHSSDCEGWSCKAHADVGHVVVFVNSENGGRVVLLHWYSPLGTLVVIRVDAKDAEVLHCVKVLPQAVLRNVLGAKPGGATASEVSENLLYVATTSKRFPGAMQLCIGLLDESWPSKAWPKLAVRTEWIQILVEWQGSVDGHKVPLTMLVQSQCENSQGRIGESHVREDL